MTGPDTEGGTCVRQHRDLDFPILQERHLTSLMQMPYRH